MNYEELKKLDRDDAIWIACGDKTIKITNQVSNQFPAKPDVIVFGGHYWKTGELISEFISNYIEPKNEIDVFNFLQEIAYSISSDDTLISNELRKNVHIDYSIIFDQYNKLIRHSPNKLATWAESEAKYIWFEHILPKRRQEQFLKIIKDHDSEKLAEISARIKQIYDFSDLEIIYLKYFCSQSKTDDLDPSLNTALYLWSKQKMTGKTTIASYICSFLNGESKRNENPHKSNLSREMQMKQFDIPAAVNSRCIMLDEAAFHDMTKTYERFKSMITSNSCEIEYKYKSSHIPKRCFRNYIFTSNDDPAYFVKDEEERRILGINFKKPKQTSFEELEKIWYKFVLECNYSAIKLEAIYNEVIVPNSQDGDIKYMMQELVDIFTIEKINGCSLSGYFSVSNVMTFQEIILQKIPRNIVKDVLIRIYGQPDNKQRFWKNNRIQDGDPVVFPDKEIELPF